MATTRATRTKSTQRAVSPEKKTISRPKPGSSKPELNQSGIYIIASSLLIGALAVSATVFYFGWKIMRTLDEIQYPYDASAPLSVGSMIYYGRQEGISASWLKSCIQSDKYDEAINNDIQAATDAKIDGTPGFYIGEYTSDTTMRGFIIPGNYPYATFTRAIDLVEEKGVDDAFAELTDEMKNSIYQSRYSSYVSYYTQQGDDEDTAASKADAAASSYSEEKWQIREVGLGTFDPKKEGDPKVVIVEFTDFECPVCRSFAGSTFIQLDENYIQGGKVAFYLRNFPIESLHDNAMNAARAASCANEKGKFWEIEPYLFGSN